MKLLLFFFLSLLCLSLTNGHTLCVSPSNSSCSSCPASSPCMSLNEYVSNAEKYFGDNNTRVVFLNGTHTLSNVLIVTEVYNLSLTAQNWATIECCGVQSGLAFIDAVDIQISFLEILSCGARVQQNNFMSDAALSFVRVTGITIDEVTVAGSRGFGMYTNSCCGTIAIENSLFTNNGCQDNSGNANFVFSKCDNESNNSLVIKTSKFLDGSTSHGHDQNSSAGGGIAVYSSCPGIQIHLDSVQVRNNSGGNIQLDMRDFSDRPWKVSIRHSNISDGRGNSGAGLYFASRYHSKKYPPSCDTGDKNVLEITETFFTGNRGNRYAGALMINISDYVCMRSKIEVVDCVFDGNVVDDPINGHGSAIKILKYTVPTFYNQILPLYQISIIRTRFWNNSILGTQSSVLALGSVEKVSIDDCQFVDNVGTAISLQSSNVIFDGDILFANNTATNGGALKFCESSSMFLNSNTTMTFEENLARKTGGAIFTQEPCLEQPKACFFQPSVSDDTPVSDLAQKYHIGLIFINNSADVAGDSIYGGYIENCFTYAKLLSESGTASYLLSREIFDTIFDIAEDQNTAVSSDPYDVFFCGPHGIDNTSFVKNVTIVPGKIFNIGVVAVGQLSGAAPAIINVELLSEHQQNDILLNLYNSMSAKRCKNLSLSLQTNPEKPSIGTVVGLTLKVQPNSPSNSKSEDYTKYVNALVTDCPWGFQLDTGTCECLHDLSIRGFVCDLDNLSICRYRHNKKFWIGCYPSRNETNKQNCRNKSLLLAHGCGYDHYCNSEREVTIMDDTVDIQCVKNRHGTLCGSCIEGHSVVLGTGKCHYCPHSNKYMSLVVVYLGAGILFIVALAKFRLTVTDGSLNGFILFINFVHWNRNRFFPLFVNADILRLIIAWLNFDVGIEVCFYNGLTALQMIWLQVGYILYILFLQVTVIVLCRKYVIFTRFFGINVTKVISTMFLLLYGKILQTVVDILKCTCFKNTSNSLYAYCVLSIDGSIEYGSPKHIPLLVVAALFSTLLLLFIFSLLFIQILSKISSYRCFKWVARLQPFFETITGPCNPNYAFWPGFLLFVRLAYAILVLYEAITSIADPLVIICSISILIVIVSFLNPKGVYKKWSLNILEIFFVFNLFFTGLLLCTTPAATYGHASVGIAFSVFLAYQIHIRFRFTKGKRLIVKCAGKLVALCSRWKRNGESLQQPVSHTEVTIRTCLPSESSPLLPAQVMPPVINYSKFREPLVDQ